MRSFGDDVERYSRICWSSDKRKRLDGTAKASLPPREVLLVGVSAGWHDVKGGSQSGQKFHYLEDFHLPSGKETLQDLRGRFSQYNQYILLKTSRGSVTFYKVEPRTIIAPTDGTQVAQ